MREGEIEKTEERWKGGGERRRERKKGERKGERERD